jgi:hypothetical protein
MKQYPCCDIITDVTNTDKNSEGKKSPQRQASLDSGYTGDLSGGSEMAMRTGFRPLSMYHNLFTVKPVQRKTLLEKSNFIIAEIC